jgi:hypothetical protein
MLKMIRVSAMLLVFAGSAYAGEIFTPPAPEFPKTNAVAEPPAANEVTAEMTATMTQIVLTVLVNLLP